MSNKEDKKLSGEIRERLSASIVAALGFVAGLAWNDAIRSAIEYFYKTDGSGIWPKFLYAFIVTIVIVIVSYYLTKLFGSARNQS
jgi:hypothetical protein